MTSFVIDYYVNAASHAANQLDTAVNRFFCLDTFDIFTLVLEYLMVVYAQVFFDNLP